MDYTVFPVVWEPPLHYSTCVVKLCRTRVQFDKQCSPWYTFCIPDVRELIHIDDVMEDEDIKLGPNGSLIFCLE